MKDANNEKAVDKTKIASAPKNVSISTKVYSPRVNKPSVAKPIEKSKNGIEKDGQAVTINGTKSALPVKLWNKVMQINTTEKTLDYLVVSNKDDANKNNSVFCLKQTEEVIEHATENSSTLKIGQVFECVSDEFVEDLLVEKSDQIPASTAFTPVAPNKTPSTLLDTLVKEVAGKRSNPSDVQKGQTKTLTFVPSSNSACTDFRCNICLYFNDTFDEYKAHMCRTHHYNYVCEKCHDVFRTQRTFDLHLDSTGTCTHPENMRRIFICIVDPPVILMKNNKVFAFRCKHCSLAFYNQRNYVQHAQRHAKQFRCKKCPTTKGMSASLMQTHLNQH